MDDQPVRVVAAACDGACRGNPGPGGWGALLRFEDGQVRELGGADPATTNNRMELTAALALFEVLRDLPRHPDLVIRTDSRYLIDGLQRWLAGWKRKGWRTAAGGMVLNQDLWKQLDGARLPGLRLEHVRGHSGDPDNERCDQIAVAYAQGKPITLASGPRSGRRAADRQTSPASPGSAATAAREQAGPARRASAGAAAAAGSSSPEARREVAGANPAEASRPAATPIDSSKPPGADTHQDSQAAATDPAPAALRGLLSRLELADRLAAGGYGLSLVELAQLVELPLRSLEQRSSPWTWRDWRVCPLADGRWRLERGAGGLGDRPSG